MKEGDVIVGKYELTHRIAQGAMGSVFKGRHVQLGRRVALKFLRPELCNDKEAITRFLREAQAAAGIGSEHIATVTDVGQTVKGVPFLVMEYLEGETLAQALRREHRFSPSRAAHIGIQLCRALAAAHGKGFIHRDMKPDNVFLVPRDNGTDLVKVLDFGIAKVFDALNSEAASLTASGTTLGTPYYMAPEQARAEDDLDARVDVYSVGVVLYEMATGKQPFTGNNFTAIVIAAATGPPKPPTLVCKDVTPALEEVILRAMSRHRDKRYGSALELAEALEPFADLSSISPAARPSSFASAPPALAGTPDSSSQAIALSGDPTAAKGPPTERMPKAEIPPTGSTNRRRFAGLIIVALIILLTLIASMAAIGGWLIYNQGVEAGRDQTPPPGSGASTNTTDDSEKPPDSPNGASIGAETMGPTKIPASKALTEAKQHSRQKNYEACLSALDRSKHQTPLTKKMRLGCLRKAGRLGEACAIAGDCEGTLHCRVFKHRYCHQP